MDLQLSGSKPRPENGRYPTISVNNNGTVVEMHQAGWFNYRLYYSVGVLCQNTINWGEDIYLGDWGNNARIAVNDNDEVVEVHQSEGLRQAMWYRVGKVDKSTMTINWVIGKSTFFSDIGRYPAVALSNEGKVVIVYQSTINSLESHYLIGKLNSSEHSVTFIGDGPRQLFPHVRGGVSQLTIAINGSGWLIVAGKGTGHNCNFVYKVGQLIDHNDETCEIKWPQNAAIEDMPYSNYPSLGLDDKGQVISLQQTNNSITYRVGKIELDGDKLKNVAWSGDKRDYRDGGLPVIGVSNDGKYIVEEHEANTYFEKKLLYCTCNLATS